MTEADYECLLDAVADAIEVPREPKLFRYAALFQKAPRAANDNGIEWPLAPFPEGWCASC